MLGRKVGTSLLRLPITARLPLRTTAFQQDLTSRTLILCFQRYYATPGRPRKTVGEPSKPIKRAVKRQAKSTTESTAADKQVKAKKSKAADKAKTKPKASAKAKKPATATAAKRGPRPKRNSELTEEQRAVKAQGVAKAKIAELKKAALSPPSPHSSSAYNAYFKEKLKGVDVNNAEGATHRERFANIVKPVSAAWKKITAADLEHYNHLAHTAAEEGAAEYKRWVESHTAEQIQLANRARVQLRNKLDLKGKQKYSQIKDERAVKRPATSYIQFSVNRHHSGDFRNIALPERSKLIASEWKALSESEKKKYKDLQSADSSRYSTEYNDTYGHLPPGINGGQSHAVAAAA